jgi:FAD/FMN-containing dehydrogenase
MGLYGFGVDNILSINLVTAKGSAITVDSRNTDLWWALRGAGPNIGIVTSTAMKAYPTTRANNTA